LSSVPLNAAKSPLVLAIDVGSSSVRALLFDADCRQVEGTEHQITYSLETTSDGGSTAEPDALLHLVARCIDHCVTTIQEGHAVAAVAMTTFWHGMLGLDGSKTPTTPVLMWADTRSGSDARRLQDEHAAVDLHGITGCRLHSSYWPAKLCWLRRTEPEAVSRTAHWVSFSDYITWILTGSLTTSVSMASGTGIMATREMTWSEEAASVAGIDVEQLPPIVDRDQPLPPLKQEWRERWPLLADARWLPAIGDGATANIGAYCVGPDRVALTIGTSGAMRVVVDDAPDIPLATGLWRYRVDRHSLVIGGALSNGGNIMSWLANLTGDRDFDALASEASTIDPDAHGLTVLPLLAGERSPSWDDRLGGAITGMRLDTSKGDLFRAFLEATAYRFAAIYDGVRPLVTAEHDIYASGGAAISSPLWMQILADTLGQGLFALDPGAEASARGAAACALQTLGIIPSIRLEPGSGMQTYTPSSARHEAYAAGRTRQERLETALRALADTESDTASLEA
jgi:gluconokinase